MIRPITCLAFLVACGSGLYLYQVKHRVHLLDQQIVDVVHQTEQVQQQERMLRAQWALREDPERLQKLSAQFLNLQPTQQSQYATAADLGSRLPPIEQPPTAVPAPAQAVAAATAQPSPSPSDHNAPAPQDVSVASAGHELDRPAPRAEDHARPSETGRGAIRTVAEQVPAARPPQPRPHLAVIRRELPPPRPLPAARPYVAAPRPPRPMPFYARPVMAAAPRYYAASPRPVQANYGGGSLLGMAHSAAPPPPAPTPVWQDWNR